MDGDLVLPGVAGTAAVGAGLLRPGEDQGQQAEGGRPRLALHRLYVSLLLPAQVQQLQQQPSV